MAYFAGLIDGEGHIGLARQRRTDRDGRIRFIPRIMVKMLSKEANERVLVEMREIFGGSLYLQQPYEFEGRKTHKKQVAWEIRNVLAVDVLKRIQPYLRIKRKHADLIINLNFRARFRITEKESKDRENVYWQIRCLNDTKVKL